ncbi:endonuclease/exonuclease/phosphatase family protein [Microbacterium sp. NPDC079995]|uniref:endonuclease/exonuclease/phosphatase family protein n=1 Tax=unclassified Microbacterium TaxID=2609290 RepID=UPI00344F7D93
MNPLLGSIEPPFLHIATLNIRRPMPALLSRAADRWSRRRPALRRMLGRERPAVLGTQEVFPGPAADIAEALGPSYTRIGVGRNAAGRGEGCPLFFDSRRLELLDHRQCALSDTPEVAGSRSWGNPVPRTMTIGVFRDHVTRARFAVINTHLDPFSPRSRVRSAEALRGEVRRGGLPTVVLGDLNAGADSAALRALRAGDLLTDAWGAAAERVTPAWGTYTGYRAPVRDGTRIDWILTTAEITVERIGIDPRLDDGVAPSDHLPVHAAIEVPR